MKKGSIPSDLKKSDRKLKSYKKSHIKFLFLPVQVTQKAKSDRKFWIFFLDDMVKIFSKTKIFTKSLYLVSEYKILNF